MGRIHVVGAVLFHILSNYNIQKVYINDINLELINTYRQIKNNIEILMAEVELLQNAYIPLAFEEREILYICKKYNYIKINGNESDNIEKQNYLSS